MGKKRDIVFLCQYFYPEYVSSATLPWDTAEALMNHGYKVGAICGYPNEYNNEENVPMHEVHNNVDITRFKYIETGRVKKAGRIINQFSFIISCLTKLFELRKYKAIIVYSNPPILPIVPVISKKLWKNKIIFVSYDVYPEIAQAANATGENGIISKIMRKINKHLFKNVDKVIALSNDMKEFLLAHRDISKNKIEVIPNWYEVMEQKEEICCNNEDLINLKGTDNFVVSYFGNMGVCHDIETIMNAAKETNNPKVKFLFAGHGSKIPYIKQKCEEYQLDNVLVSDFLHGDDFRYAQKISDCFLVSLEKEVSGMLVPSKVYSYMAEGKPMIAIMDENTDIARDITDGKLGLVVENGDSNGIVEFVNNMFDNKELQSEMSDRCKKMFLDKYTKEICTNQYCECFDSILKPEGKNQ